MRIALIGYGKMGQMIASVARERGHDVVCIIDPLTSADTIDSPAFRSADVAIEFSRPDAAEANVRAAVAQGVPVVSGTTGWDVQALQRELQGTQHAGIIWSSNYSIGVNILFAVNKYLARLLQNAGGYSPSITEVHHIHKLDAPSGTAKTLAEDIERLSLLHSPLRGEPEGCPLSERVAGGVHIDSIREGEVPGIHEVRWESDADILSLRHEAKSRKGFALGAVLAAEWLQGRTGWHQLDEAFALTAE